MHIQLQASERYKLPNKHKFVLDHPICGIDQSHNVPIEIIRREMDSAAFKQALHIVLSQRWLLISFIFQRGMNLIQ